MDIFADFHHRIAAVLRGLVDRGRLPPELDLARFAVEPPRDASHGDIATNAAMVFGKAASSFGGPRPLAVAVAAALAEDPDVATAEVAGPGFINIVLRPAVLARVLASSLRAGALYGRAEGEAREPVNVEYVSTNPTGPLHVGHGRGAVFGDALANLLAYAGAPVTREYYINDAGAQVDVLARSAFHRYREALGEDLGPVPDGLYPGDYLREVGADLARLHAARLRDLPEAAWMPIVRDAAIEAMMARIRDDLAALGIRHDVFFSERSLVTGAVDAVAETIGALRRDGLVYEGRLPPPKGQVPDDWEDREQVLFRSTRFGDDVDRPLVKSDGGYTYFASDMAYHRSKLARGFRHMIDVWGADHGGYVKRMRAAVQALGGAEADLDVKLCQLVKLMRHGEPVKMSKRSGDFVTLREVVDEVGADAVRFMMLYRKNDAPLDFDLAKVIEQSKDNPVFYVQYAHARAGSVLRMGQAALPDLDLSGPSLAEAPLARLDDAGEIGIARLVAQYPRLVDTAAAAHEPHRIAFYMHDLASAFHSHWNRGKDQPQLRFVNQEQRDLTFARLGLVAAVANVLRSGLGILGVGAPDEMR